MSNEPHLTILDEAIMSMGYAPSSPSALGTRLVETGSADLAHELASYLRDLGFRAQASSFGLVLANPNY